MKKDYKKVFQKGLIAVAPLALTFALIGWMFSTIEGVFGVPFRAILGERFYFPGIGILFFIIFTFAVGSFLNNLLVQKIYHLGEKLLVKIPLVKTLYNSIREMMNYFKTDEKKKKIGHVVRVEIGGFHMLGLVTREEFEGLPKGIATPDEVSVFIPMSYQIGGYSIIVPRSKIEKIDMTIEEAMRYAITAGALSQKTSQEKHVTSEAKTKQA